MDTHKPIAYKTSDNVINELKSFIDEDAIPYSLGSMVSSSPSFRKIKYKSENEQILVQILPSDVTNEVKDRAEEVDVIGVVINRRKSSAGLLSSEYIDESPHIPKLIQAFHEGYYDERDADYRYKFADRMEIAKPSNNPIPRLETEITITAVEYIGGSFPRKWMFETDNGDYLYLRERSGSIRLYDEAGNGDEIFNVYVGREHPGTRLEDHEILNIITSVDYINMVDDPDDSVSEEAQEMYWNGLPDDVFD